MTETDVKKLFLIINNTFHSFPINPTKVSIWADLMRDVDFELAQRNLRQYILEPHEFPPTIGQLAKRPEAAAEGRHIPDVAETQLLLENRFMIEEPDGSLRPVKPVPMPEHLRVRLQRYVGDKSIS